MAWQPQAELKAPNCTKLVLLGTGAGPGGPGMKADHTPVEDVGRIAQEAGVKTLVLSHLIPAIDSISDDSWREPAAKYFKGEIIVGKDLMVV
jgi:ribonuclease BN (tRNA processing enzyme)